MALVGNTRFRKGVQYVAGFNLFASGAQIYYLVMKDLEETLSSSEKLWHTASHVQWILETIIPILIILTLLAYHGGRWAFNWALVNATDPSTPVPGALEKCSRWLWFHLCVLAISLVVGDGLGMTLSAVALILVYCFKEELENTGN